MALIHLCFSLFTPNQAPILSTLSPQSVLFLPTTPGFLAQAARSALPTSACTLICPSPLSKALHAAAPSLTLDLTFLPLQLPHHLLGTLRGTLVPDRVSLLAFPLAQGLCLGQGQLREQLNGPSDLSSERQQAGSGVQPRLEHPGPPSRCLWPEDRHWGLRNSPSIIPNPQRHRRTQGGLSEIVVTFILRTEQIWPHGGP